uniref:Putative secreted protein n=1 Tax=Anopheles darlingi TaxID=43151 RepID=A0A2M4D3D4_ANODA
MLLVFLLLLLRLPAPLLLLAAAALLLLAFRALTLALSVGLPAPVWRKCRPNMPHQRSTTTSRRRLEVTAISQEALFGDKKAFGARISGF